MNRVLEMHPQGIRNEQGIIDASAGYQRCIGNQESKVPNTPLEKILGGGNIPGFAYYFESQKEKYLLSMLFITYI